MHESCKILSVTWPLDITAVKRLIDGIAERRRGAWWVRILYGKSIGPENAPERLTRPERLKAAGIWLGITALLWALTIAVGFALVRVDPKMEIVHIALVAVICFLMFASLYGIWMTLKMFLGWLLPSRVKKAGPPMYLPRPARKSLSAASGGAVESIFNKHFGPRTDTLNMSRRELFTSALWFGVITVALFVITAALFNRTLFGRTLPAWSPMFGFILGFPLFGSLAGSLYLFVLGVFRRMDYLPDHIYTYMESGSNNYLTFLYDEPGEARKRAGALNVFLRRALIEDNLRGRPLRSEESRVKALNEKLSSYGGWSQLEPAESYLLRKPAGSWDRKALSLAKQASLELETLAWSLGVWLRSPSVVPEGSDMEKLVTFTVDIQRSSASFRPLEDLKAEYLRLWDIVIALTYEHNMRNENRGPGFAKKPGNDPELPDGRPVSVLDDESLDKLLKAYHLKAAILNSTLPFMPFTY